MNEKKPLLARPMICLVVFAMTLPHSVSAAPLILSTAPAGTNYKPPAPNVIVSVDDSTSMEASGIAALKEALRQTFAESRVSDGDIRLAWQAMNNCYEIPSEDCQGRNVMKVLDAAHRANFMTWVETLRANANTPSHRMLRNAGEYLKRPLDVNSAWASVPGTALEPVLACRRTYNLFMTDGGWNKNFNGDDAIGDADGRATTLPDGTPYDITAEGTRLYRDSAAGTISGSSFTTTMSDLAFHYWATDLQPGIANSVRPKIKQKSDALFNAGGATATVPPYWNARNDPATWQHMNMYTVGFNEAAKWKVDPRFGTDTWTGGDYEKLVTGAKSWPNPITGSETNERVTELWHMALNGRGKFIPAPNAAALATAFQDVLDDIIVDKTAPVTSLSASSQTTRLASAAFAASYDGSRWSGAVTRYDLANGTGLLDTNTGHWRWGVNPATPAVPATANAPAVPAKPASPKSTADLMDAGDATWLSNRLVLSNTTATTGGVTTSRGISWTWANLSDAQKTALKTVAGSVDTSSTADAVATDRQAYIRGDRTKEHQAMPPGPFRDRTSRHGDIVNSKLWYLDGKPGSGYTQNNYATFRSNNASRISMLYVGANDGMLHGFDASNGQEKLAYIPEGIASQLADLTRPAYSHRYFVDGSPFTADLYKDGGWKTYLAGFLGAGGKGYFVLDVTDPANFVAANAANLVVMDRTASTGMDPDVGRIFSEPVTERGDPAVTRQIARLNNGRWALVTGNGYNSSSEKAVLLIQYLDGTRELLKITADATGNNGNGLSAPRLIDLNGDDIPDVAYAGDLRGNLWKFDLTSNSATNWNVAFSGTPLFVAKDATGDAALRQPITAAPAWLAHPQGGLMIVFGTGQNLTDADRATTGKQTLYGIYDATPITRNAKTPDSALPVTVTLGSGSAITGGRGALVAQSVGSASAGTTTDTRSDIWLVSSNPVTYTGSAAKKGWYMDLPASGERLLQSVGWFDGNLIDARSLIPRQGGDPNTETCDPPATDGKQYRTILNALDGNAPVSQIYGYTATATTDSGRASRVEDAPGIGIGGRPKEIIFTPPGSARVAEPNKLGLVTLRPSWRQLQ